MKDTNDIRTAYDTLGENQCINACDSAVEHSISIDGVVKPGAEIDLTRKGLTIRAEGSADRFVPWTDVVSVDLNDENDLIVRTEDGTEIVESLRILA